jgi:hypothetical protein
MDQYSLHEFLIRRGSTVDSTPEFLSFHRTYSEKWGPIAELVLQLEVPPPSQSISFISTRIQKSYLHSFTQIFYFAAIVIDP